jgi:Fe-S-cluster containining protein
MFPDCKISNFTQAKKCGANLLAKKDDDSCIYLINHQCSIHTTRPNVCRNFFCTSQMKKFISMVEIIKKNDHQKKSSVFTP